MRRYCKPTCIVLFLGSLLFGIIYPLGIWCIAHLFFPWQAEGSPLVCQGTVVGLANIGQSFSRPEYFWVRPSASGSSPQASGGSNLSWSQPELPAIVQQRSIHLERAGIKKPIPEDLLMASASGLDPDISIYAAMAQAERIARIRNLSKEQIFDLIVKNESPTYFGLFPRRINVLKLNCELDRLYPIGIIGCSPRQYK